MTERKNLIKSMFGFRWKVPKICLRENEFKIMFDYSPKMFKIKI